MRILPWFVGLFTGKGEDQESVNNGESNIASLSSPLPRSAAFANLFQEHKPAEYHFERFVYAALCSSGLIKKGVSHSQLIFIKESSAGNITCQLKVNKQGEREKNIFRVSLNHVSDDTLQLQSFSLSTYCCNLNIEKEVYRYLAIIASEAGYSYLEPSGIVYESKDDFDFSTPDIGDLFPFLGHLRRLLSEKIQEMDSEADGDDLRKLLELVHPVEFNLFNLISYEQTVAVPDLIIRTNRDLSEIQKNYLIKMARTLYCGLHTRPDHRTTVRGQCVLLSQIVFFLAADKLNIPVPNLTILDGCMKGMGAHTVAAINGRIVDATSDQFHDGGRWLNVYEDNSIYFDYSKCSPSEYNEEYIQPYIELFRSQYKEISVEDFLRSTDKYLFKRSSEAQVWS